MTLSIVSKISKTGAGTHVLLARRRGSDRLCRVANCDHLKYLVGIIYSLTRDNLRQILFIDDILSHRSDYYGKLIELEGILHAESGGKQLWYLSSTRIGAFDPERTILIQRKIQEIDLRQYLKEYALTDLTWQLESFIEQSCNTPGFIYQERAVISGILRQTNSDGRYPVLTDLISITVFRDDYQCKLSHDLNAIWHRNKPQKCLEIKDIFSQVEELNGKQIYLEGQLVCNHICMLVDANLSLNSHYRILIQEENFLSKLKTILSPRSGKFIFSEWCWMGGRLYGNNYPEFIASINEIKTVEIKRKYGIFTFTL